MKYFLFVKFFLQTWLLCCCSRFASNFILWQHLKTLDSPLLQHSHVLFINKSTINRKYLDILCTPDRFQLSWDQLLESMKQGRRSWKKPDWILTQPFSNSKHGNWLSKWHIFQKNTKPVILHFIIPI